MYALIKTNQTLWGEDPRNTELDPPRDFDTRSEEKAIHLISPSLHCNSDWFSTVQAICHFSVKIRHPTTQRCRVCFIINHVVVCFLNEWELVTGQSLRWRNLYSRPQIYFSIECFKRRTSALLSLADLWLGPDDWLDKGSFQIPWSCIQNSCWSFQIACHIYRNRACWVRWGWLPDWLSILCSCVCATWTRHCLFHLLAEYTR